MEGEREFTTNIENKFGSILLDTEHTRTIKLNPQSQFKHYHHIY